MIHFATPGAAKYLLLLVLVGYALYRSDKRSAAAIQQLRIQSHVPDTHRRANFGPILAWLGILALLVLTLMRPQGEAIATKQTVRSANLILAVDVSKSMLSDDVRPNRLERAKREILDLLDELKGEQLGLVIFSGSAFIQTPLTNDYSAFKTFLDLADPSLSPLDGSDLEQGLIKSFEALGFDEQNSTERRGAIILFSDGETFRDPPTAVAEFAKEHGIPIYAYTVGTETGGPIRVQSGLKRDQDGQIVITRADSKFLEEFTESAGGFAVASVPGNQDSDRILAAINKLDPTEESTRIVQKFRELFQIPLLLALCGMVALQRRIGW